MEVKKSNSVSRQCRAICSESLFVVGEDSVASDLLLTVAVSRGSDHLAMFRFIWQLVCCYGSGLALQQCRPDDDV
jgi:hypothetical protein